MQSAAGSLLDSMASPTKSPRKSPSKVKENELPLQDCTPISMSFNSPAKKKNIDDRYLQKESPEKSPEKNSGGKRLPKSPVKRMRKLEQEQEAAQVDVETAYKASPEKAIKVDEEMQ